MEAIDWHEIEPRGRPVTGRVGCIVKTLGRWYTVESGGERLNCVLRGKLKSDKRLERFSEPVAVGDIVDFLTGDDGSGTIERVHERRNAFTRKDKWRTKEDIIAANLDLVVVIQSFRGPRLNLRFVDRLMVRGEAEGIPVLVCVNKTDLAESGEREAVEAYYAGSGAELEFVSALKGDGLGGLSARLAGRLSLLAGSSGVGKSTLLNALYSGLDLRTSEVSESTGKGRHTTTNAEMVIAGGGTRIIDTPGLREFGLMDIEPEALGRYFREFARPSARCAFRPCTHEHEPRCRVRELVEKGKISEGRYVSYLNILYQLREYHATKYR